MNNQLIVIVVIVIVAVVGFSILRTANQEQANNGAISKIVPDTYQEQYANSPDHVLIDVRTPEEYAGGHITNSVNISVQTLESRLDEVPTDKTIVVYCHSGNRSATASRILESAGYTDIKDLGGIFAWQQAGYPIVQ